MSSGLAYLQTLFTRPKGLRSIYDLFDSRLTAARAALLDRLQNLTGPVALQGELGTPTDTPSTLTTVHASMQAIEAIICDIEAQIRVLAANPGDTLIYTVNTVITSAANQGPTGLVDSGCYTPYGSNPLACGFIIPDLTGGGGASYEMSGGSGITSSTGSQGPSLQAVTTTQVTTSSIQDIVNPPIIGVASIIVGGCSGVPASGIRAIVNGADPYNGQSGGQQIATNDFAWRIGAEGKPYIGVKHLGSGAFRLEAFDGTTVTYRNLVSVAYPHLMDFVASGPSAGVTLTDNLGRVLTIPLANCPPANAPLPVHVYRNSHLYFFQVGYI